MLPHEYFYSFDTLKYILLLLNAGLILSIFSFRYCYFYLNEITEYFLHY